MTATIDALVHIGQLFDRSFDPYVKALRRLIRAHGGEGDRQAALESLAALIAETNGTADMLGREQAWLYAASRDGADAVMGFARGLPSAVFAEAVDDIASRAPRVVSGAAERAADEVARIYSTEHAIAFAESASLEVTKKVQALLSAAVAEGQGALSATALVRRATDWTQAYAQTVYRTGVGNAYTAGRFRQMQDPDVSRVIGALRYGAVLDPNTRANHAAADGMIAAVGDPVWSQMAPPAGFNCRCTVEFVDWIELRRLGLADGQGNVRPGVLPPGALPDPGFRHSGRPDIAIYGGAA